MCKVCGFADHGHNAAPCTKCTVPLSEMFSEKSLRNEYPARSGEEHQRRCFRWKSLDNAADRDEFFTAFGSRWTEFARLPYFDLVRYTLIDPMHNILQGIAKNQWYAQWIKTKALRASTPKQGRELGMVHKFLETFESPLWAGRLPLRMGEPAGGSLTADEYKLASTVALPMIIPVVWDAFLDASKKEFSKEMKAYRVALKQHKQELLAWQSQHDGDTAGEQSPQKKARLEAAQRPAATKPSRTATSKKRKAELYGEGAMKPNHHWVVHLPDQIRDYAAVYNFWLFLVERLNKTLKNYNNNHHGGGELEVTLMRTFYRECRTRTMVRE
ncbi:hypothetical protein OE88DRAFT_1712157 [Heliocybe sulcata]|uniref:Uncharacterized protein n=1 Tax=Heliocybe sulcata TaxID=5364 RepID=A0A5C3N4T4_9AGAM|nr:hypothetical protein OE88DRAFT_1712157 [Heliocybe sulcata]